MHFNGPLNSGVSFAVLFESCYPMVKAIAGRIVRDEQIAEDIAQDVFVKAYIKRGTLREYDKIKSWLQSILAVMLHLRQIAN